MLSKHSDGSKSGPSLSHNILINQSPDGRHEEVVEEKSDVSRGWFMKLKERNHICNIKVQTEAASANVEAAARYTKYFAKIIYEGDYPEIFNIHKTMFF